MNVVITRTSDRNVNEPPRDRTGDGVIDSDDDGLCFKSEGPAACEDITVTNCIVSSHCNAIKMGTESNGGFKNITISNG